MRRWPVRYVGWMTRDLLLGPGWLLVAIVLVVAFVVSRSPERAYAPSDGARLFAAIVSGFDWLVVLAASGGIVSGDLASGIYRTLFTRPVSPALYYLQRWLLGGALVALFAPLLALALWPVIGLFPWSWGVFVRFLVLYLLLGGLTFALSTVFRRDWPIALLILVLQSALHAITSSAESLGLVTRAALAILPPFNRAQTDPRTTLATPYFGDLYDALVYGVLLVSIAIVVLSRRPLGSGGRS